MAHGAQAVLWAMEFDGHTVQVALNAGLDQAGAVQFASAPLPLGELAKLVVDRIRLPGFEIADFRLSANSADGTALRTDELFFNRYKESSQEGALALTADCQRAFFRSDCEPRPLPKLRLLALGLAFGRKLRTSSKVEV